MALNVARFANLFLTGVLTGNEFGGLVGFHPALYRLPTEAHASAEQEITARFGKIMPPFMIATIVSFAPVLSLTRERRSFRFTLAGMLCYLVMLAVTFSGNMPTNRRTLELDPRIVSRNEFLALRRRWDLFHTARNLLNAAGLVFAILGTLSDAEARDRGSRACADLVENRTHLTKLIGRTIACWLLNPRLSTKNTRRP